MKPKRRTVYIIAGLVLIAALYLLVKLSGKEEAGAIKVAVKKGRLDVSVTTTGELQAQNSEDIKGPFGLRQANIYQVKISDLIPEGTLVKEGDYIAMLDRSEISGKLKELGNELSKNESQYLQTRLDTALEMRKLRDDLINQKFDMEEKKLIMEQSKYEPPAVIRQAEIDLEKAKRNYEQAKKNYDLKLQQNKAKMQEVAATLNQQKAKYDQMNELVSEFVVKAPKAGMLIYKKDWSGRKIKTGGTISAWDLGVATLPDLSTMISQTYVNEIDISKIKKGQPVSISVDAFPDRKYRGKVISIANVGEQLPRNDTKVFEVNILLEDKDTMLRPAMTTSNVILTQSLPDVLYIPLDALQSNDSITYVYKQSGTRTLKQEIITGTMSSDFAEIKAGLEEGDMVYLSAPANAQDLKVAYLPEDVKKQYRKAVAATPAPKPAEIKDEDGPEVLHMIR